MKKLNCMIANKKSALAPVLKELRSLRQTCQVGVAQQKTCFVSAVTGSGLIPPGSDQELQKDSNPGEKRTEYVEDHSRYRVTTADTRRSAQQGLTGHLCCPVSPCVSHKEFVFKTSFYFQRLLAVLCSETETERVEVQAEQSEVLM